MKRITATFGTVLLLVLGYLSFASSASAATTATPDASSVTVVNQTVNSAAQWNGQLVQWWSISHTKKQKHRIKRGRCIWSNGWNYYSQTDLSKGKHWDTHMRLCRDKKSPTGWVKVGGGQSGSHCWNPATPVGHKPLHVPTLGTITEVKSFALYFGSMTAVSDVYLKIHKVCGEDTIDTTMMAHASAGASVLLQLAYKAHGQSQAFKDSLKLYLAGSAEASTSVQVYIQCTSTPPPPPPPAQHWTQISCTGFEEISGGGSFIVKCDIANDNGAPIALSAHSNDSNSRVSGINCYSQGGAASCTGNGTYEFTVTGVNDGTTVLSSSVSATATSNGVSATFNSDPFPVDPSSGGF